jgi:hypothetical protein
VFLLATLALATTLGVGWMKIRHMMLALPPDPPRIDQRHTEPSRPVSPLLLQYRLEVPGRGEIFPALAAASAADYWPAAILTITNTADQPALQIIRSGIEDFSRSTEHTVIVGPKQTLSVPIVPDLLPSAFALEEIAHAPLTITVANEDGSITFARSQAVLLHSGSDLYWGKQFANAQLIARWVTPHDPSVLQLVSHAHRYIANGRMPGYNISERNARFLPAQVTAQAQAIFRAIQDSGFAYVSSIFTFGGVTETAQRIRLPRSPSPSLRPSKTSGCNPSSSSFQGTPSPEFDSAPARPTFSILTSRCFRTELSSRLAHAPKHGAKRFHPNRF